MSVKVSSITLKDLPLHVFRPKEHLSSFLLNSIRYDGRQLYQTRPLSVVREVFQPFNSLNEDCHTEEKDLEGLSFQIGSSRITLGSCSSGHGATMVLAVIHASVISLSKQETDLVGNLQIAGSSVVASSTGANSVNTSGGKVIEGKKGRVSISVAMNHLFPSVIKAEGYAMVNNKAVVAIELENYLQTLFTKGKIFPLEELLIQEGKYAFELSINLTILSNQGNLRDACVYAVMVALKDAELPKLSLSQATATGRSKKSSVTYYSIGSNDSQRYKLSVVPVIPLTLSIYSNLSTSTGDVREMVSFADPTDKEELHQDGAVHLVVNPLNAEIHFQSVNGNGLNQVTALGLIERSIYMIQKDLFPQYLEILTNCRGGITTQG